MNSSPDPLISLSTNLARATNLIADIRYSPSRLADLSAAALACNCVEIGTSIFHLADCNAKAGLPVLLRSLLESSMRLALIAKDPACGHLSLELIDNIARLKLVGKNMPDKPLSIFLQSRNKELASAGAKKYSFADLLNHVNATDWYSIYRVFSAFSHAQLSALAEHFFEKQPTGTEIHWNRGLDERQFIAYFLTADQLVCIAIDAIERIFRIEAQRDTITFA